MSRRTLTLAGIVVLSTAVILMLLWRPSSAPAPGGAPPPVQTAQHTEPAPAASPWSVLKKPPSPAPGGSEYAAAARGPVRLERPRLEGFLSGDPANPQRWAAVYDFTGDSALLKEALERFPDDKALLTRLLVSKKDAPPAELTAAAERLLKAHPEESTARYALASSALRAGDREEGIRSLEEALTKKPPVLLSAEDVLLRRAALESAGYPSALAGLTAFSAGYDGDAFHALFVDTAIALQQGAANGSLSADTGAAFSEHMRLSGNTHFGSEIMALAFQKGFLESIEPEAEFGETGKSAGERLEELRRETEENTGILGAIDGMLNSASEAEISLWSSRALVHGPLAAFKAMAEERMRKGDGP